MVWVRHERERQVGDNTPNAEHHQRQAAAKLVTSGEDLKSSEHSENNLLDGKIILVIILSDWENEIEYIVGGKEWNEKQNGEKKNSIVYIGNMAYLQNAMEYGKWRKEVVS